LRKAPLRRQNKNKPESTKESAELPPIEIKHVISTRSWSYERGYMAYVTFPSVVKKAHNPFAGGGKVDVAHPSSTFAMPLYFDHSS
jgi:hypothetical protein